MSLTTVSMGYAGNVEFYKINNGSINDTITPIAANLQINNEDWLLTENL